MGLFSLSAFQHVTFSRVYLAYAKRELTPVVPPTKAQVVERKTLQLGEVRFETCGGRRTLGTDGPRARLRKMAPHSLCRTAAQTELGDRRDKNISRHQITDKPRASQQWSRL